MKLERGLSAYRTPPLLFLSPNLKCKIICQKFSQQYISSRQVPYQSYLRLPFICLRERHVVQKCVFKKVFKYTSWNRAYKVNYRPSFYV